MSTPAVIYDPLREAQEFREKLGSDKRRLAFLFGAGTSQAVGLEGIAGLTLKISAHLTSAQREHYERFLQELGAGTTVEHVLDIVRLCRELVRSGGQHDVRGLRGNESAELDRAICQAIFKEVSVDPPSGLVPHLKFAGWVRSVSREHPIEVFTTNYDLLIERGLEAAETPHFDGFVGTVEPYFSSISVEAEPARATEGVYPPRSWVRVWKLHGSIGWRVQTDSATKATRIIRTPRQAPQAGDDLMIFPSREKYSDSRKLPFVAYHDRLRRLLSSGETLLVVAGYSFGDEHLNEIVFEGLRNNTRLAVVVVLYEPLATAERLLSRAPGLRNLLIYGPDSACLGGVSGKWSTSLKTPPESMGSWPFWAESDKRFILGDFSALANFLELFVGGGRTVDASGAQ